MRNVVVDEETTVVGSPPAAAISASGESQLAEVKHDDSRLRAIEDEVYEKHLGIVSDATRFSEIPYDATQPPQEWFDELGAVKAWRRFRVAKGAQMSAKEAPVGLAMAMRVVSGMARARAVERTGGTGGLNVVLGVSIHAPSSYKKVEVLDE